VNVIAGRVGNLETDGLSDDEGDRLTAVERKSDARARARGRAQANNPAAVVNARYDQRRECVEVTFRAGVSVAISRKMVPGLERASRSNLRAVQISPAGDALSWGSLDVDVYVPELMARAVGTRLIGASLVRPGANSTRAKLDEGKGHRGLS